MEIFYDCLPCILRQTIELLNFTTEEADKRNQIIKETIKLISDFENYKCSPEITRDLHLRVKAILDIDDIYKDIKKQDIESAKKLLPLLNEHIKKSDDKLKEILKISAIGNIIDSAINLGIKIEDCIEAELKKDFSHCDIEIFTNKLEKANKILIIGDNSGESVFDCLLAKYLSLKEIIYAVRDTPVLNDVTIEDAKNSGLEECTKIISSGCNSPGTLLNEASEEFLKIFNEADIVISKGQGNYEALTPCGRDIFFLLKAKCRMVAKHLDVTLGGYVFKYSEN